MNIIRIPLIKIGMHKNLGRFILSHKYEWKSSYCKHPPPLCFLWSLSAGRCTQSATSMWCEARTYPLRFHLMFWICCIFTLVGAFSDLLMCFGFAGHRKLITCIKTYYEDHCGSSPVFCESEVHGACVYGLLTVLILNSVMLSDTSKK